MFSLATDIDYGKTERGSFDEKELNAIIISSNSFFNQYNSSINLILQSILFFNQFYPLTDFILQSILFFNQFHSSINFIL